MHLKVDDDADDALITSLITAAREWSEGYQGRAYIEQTITAKLDCFSDIIRLPQAPLISVTSIKYIDSNGTTQTLSSTYYNVHTNAEPGFIELAYNMSWPSVRNVKHAVEIVYKAGYGTAAASVPTAPKAAMKLIIGHLYAKRENSIAGSITDIPLGAAALLSMNRMYL